MKPQDDPALRPASQQCAGLPLLAPASIPAETRRAARRKSDLEAKRDEVLAAYRKWGPMTPDLCAERLKWSILETRPRCTELAGTKKQPVPLLVVVGEGLSSLNNPMGILDLASRARSAA